MQWLRTNFFFSRNKFWVQIFFSQMFIQRWRWDFRMFFSLQNFIHFLSQVAQGKKKKKKGQAKKKN
jgi:hypothetical protein